MVIFIGGAKETGKDTLGSVLANDFFRLTNKRAVVVETSAYLKKQVQDYYGKGIFDIDKWQKRYVDGCNYREETMPNFGISRRQLLVEFAEQEHRKKYMYHLPHIFKGITEKDNIIITGIRFIDEIKYIRKNYKNTFGIYLFNSGVKLENEDNTESGLVGYEKLFDHVIDVKSIEYEDYPKIFNNYLDNIFHRLK